MRTNNILAWVFVCLLVIAPAVSVADQQEIRDQVRFEVEVGRDVENDRVVAIMNVTEEHKDPAALADTINSTMKWALAQARASEKVKLRSGSYHTSPVYDDKKIVRWRGRQELHLESQSVNELSQLIGTLQSRLQMQHLRFSVSPETRQQVEDQLIEQALAAFQRRAVIVQKSLGAKRYSISELTINTGDQPPVIPIRAQAMSIESRAAVAPPAIEGGTSRVTVQVAGAVRLLRD
jgi:predicted secreted protein